MKKSREREALPKKGQGWGGWFLEVGGIRPVLLMMGEAGGGREAG